MTMMTACPKLVQYEAVSTTIRPVTQVADVAVNSAVSGEVKTCACEDIGSISKNAPKRIIPRKAATIMRKGCICFFLAMNNVAKCFRLILTPPISRKNND
jgi:hypothetical protein